MSVIVTQPFLQFHDRAGQPLNGGYVYVGLPGLNPEAAPITVYWDAAGLNTAVQPIRTINGYASRDGSPSNVLAASAPYSIVVRDADGSLVYSDLNFDPATALGLTSVYRQLLTATAGQTVFTLGRSYNVGSGALEVYVNGLLVETPTDYAETTPTRITFAVGLAVGDEVTVIIRG